MIAPPWGVAFCSGEKGCTGPSNQATPTQTAAFNYGSPVALKKKDSAGCSITGTVRLFCVDTTTWSALIVQARQGQLEHFFSGFGYPGKADVEKRQTVHSLYMQQSPVGDPCVDEVQFREPGESL